MGDGFQIIADVEATEGEAPGLAVSVVSWLAGEGIIAAGPTGCALGSESGYPPGPRYTAAVTGPGEWLLGLRTNGVGVCSSRNVFAPLRGEANPRPGHHAAIWHGLAAPAVTQIALIQDGHEDRRPLDSHFGAWVICAEQPSPVRVVGLDQNGTVLADITEPWDPP